MPPIPRRAPYEKIHPGRTDLFRALPLRFFRHLLRHRGRSRAPYSPRPPASEKVRRKDAWLYPPGPDRPPAFRVLAALPGDLPADLPDGLLSFKGPGPAQLGLPEICLSFHPAPGGKKGAPAETFSCLHGGRGPIRAVWSF